MLEQTLQGGGGGGDAKEAASLRTPEPPNPSIVDDPLVEGPVDCRDDILDLDGEGLNRPCENQLETSQVDRRSCGCVVAFGLKLLSLDITQTVRWRWPSQKIRGADGSACILKATDLDATHIYQGIQMNTVMTFISPGDSHSRSSRISLTLRCLSLTVSLIDCL